MYVTSRPEVAVEKEVQVLAEAKDNAADLSLTLQNARPEVCVLSFHFC